MSLQKNNEIINMAKEYLNSHQVQIAKTLLEDKIVKNPCAESYYLLGTIEQKNKNYKKAIEFFKRSLKKDSLFKEAGVALTVLLNDLGRYEEAQKIFQLLKSFHKNHNLTKQKEPLSLSQKESLLEDHCENIKALLFAGDFEGAKNETSFIESLLPTSNKNKLKEAQKQIMKTAETYAFHGQHKESLFMYSHASKIYPNPLCKLKMVETLETLNQKEKAFSLLQALQKEFPHFSPGLLKLGKVYYGKGLITEALHCWETVLRNEPENKLAKDYILQGKNIGVTKDTHYIDEQEGSDNTL